MMQTDSHQSNEKRNNNVIQMNSVDQAEEMLNQHETAIVYFTAPGCSVCQAVKPRIIQLAEQFNVPMLLSSIDQHVAFSAQQLVFTVPTVLVMYQGREICRESRFIDFSRLERTLQFIAD